MQKLPISINGFQCNLIFEENSNIISIRILSQLNTSIYHSKINQLNELIAESYSHAYFTKKELDELRTKIENIIINNI